MPRASLSRWNWVLTRGWRGIGLTFFGGPLTVALRDAVEALGALVIGENPLQVEAIAAKLRQAASGAGPGGLFTLALSAIDIALWDIKGKALGQSVHALLGGYRDRAPNLRERRLDAAVPHGVSGRGRSPSGADGF